MELSDGRFIAGIVLSTAQDPVPFGDRLWGMPVSALWEPGTPADYAEAP